MARVKNITGDRLHLFTPDAPPVEPDDIVEISDERFANRAWPKSTWQVTAKPGRGFKDESTDDAVLFTTTAAEADETESAS